MPVIAFQIAGSMEEQNVTKAEMARRMNTSRAAVDRLLDPDNESATLITLEKAALAVGKRLQVTLV
jgi:antitoxin HicB